MPDPRTRGTQGPAPELRHRGATLRDKPDDPPTPTAEGQASAFWPPFRPDFKIPHETLANINAINDKMLAWRDNIMGVAPGFRPIHPDRSQPHLNQKRARALRPEAVHPTEVPTTQGIVLAGGSSPPPKRAAPEAVEQEELMSFNSSQRTGGSPPPKIPDTGIDKTGSITPHLWWGLAILVVLGLVTFRKEIKLR